MNKLKINIGDKILFNNKAGTIIAHYYEKKYSLFIPKEIFVAFDSETDCTLISLEFVDIWMQVSGGERYYYECLEDISPYCGLYGLWVSPLTVTKNE